MSYDTWCGVKHRSVHIIALAALLLIAFDSFVGDSPPPNVLAPEMWFALYCGVSAAVIMFIAFGTTLTLQAMTLMVSAIGLSRGLAFLYEDGVTTPLGLNVLVALYATFAHRYERDWMRKVPCS